MTEPARKSPGRLYRHVAQQLLDAFVAGEYAIGDRLPTEREFAAKLDVSRPTIREAIIALEVQGYVEVRIGSGAYLLRLPDAQKDPAHNTGHSDTGTFDTGAFDTGAFELSEARLLIEGECAALAAGLITDEELDQLERLIADIANEKTRSASTEHADREFHLTIARATGNAALVQIVERLWDLRGNSDESAQLYQTARIANVTPVVAEHSAILAALRTRDPGNARAAMHGHLTAVIDSLLYATEEQAIEQARQASLSRRERYSRPLG